MARRALLLVNPRSRQGPDGASHAEELLRAAGLHVTRASVSRSHDLADVIRAHAKSIDLVIVGGGDGSMNAAVDALVETGLPLGLLPLGTANDLARTLGIEPDLEKAVEVITAGHTRWLDLGRVNSKHFFNVASIGLSVRIAQELDPEMKRRWGVISYALATWRVLREMRSFRATILAPEGKHEIRAMQIGVGNGRHYGGGLTVSESAQIDDGLLHLYALRPQSLWQLVRRYPRFRAGQHDDPETVLALDAPSFTIETDRPMRINTDGEITSRTPARFEVVPRALEVLAPRPETENTGAPARA